MKKIFTIFTLFFVVLVGLFALNGCKKEEVGAGVISVQVVDFEGKDLFNDQIEFSADDTLVDLLKNNEEILMTGETSEYGFYIVSMCGVSASNDNKTYWSIEVNGEYSMVGVSDITLIDEDLITFSLIGW